LEKTHSDFKEQKNTLKLELMLNNQPYFSSALIKDNYRLYKLHYLLCIISTKKRKSLLIYVPRATLSSSYRLL